MESFKQGIAICTYNRVDSLPMVIEGVLKTKPAEAQVIVCDDGSTDGTVELMAKSFPDLNYIRGKNLGVGANKNRALFTLKHCDFICILEDDLIPTESDWFETYQEFCLSTNIHHLCRVQDKRVPETVPDFTEWCKVNLNITPIYGPSPRGDMTFISSQVLCRVGAIHPDFVGVGHAHGQWSDRVIAAGLVGHPNKWIDLEEVSLTFKQFGDRAGGRWALSEEETKRQVVANAELRKRLGTTPIFIHQFLP